MTHADGAAVAVLTHGEEARKLPSPASDWVHGSLRTPNTSFYGLSAGHMTRRGRRGGWQMARQRHVMLLAEAKGAELHLSRATGNATVQPPSDDRASLTEGVNNNGSGNKHILSTSQPTPPRRHAPDGRHVPPRPPTGTMSYGSIDGGAFGGPRNPFGGPSSRGYQPQQTNRVITSSSQLIKQLSDIISGSSRQDRLRLTRLKTELSESVQRYADLQKKIAERTRALLPPAQTESKSPQTPFTELCEEGPLFAGAEGSEGSIQAFLSEISEEDVEVLRQREEAMLQIESDMLDVSQIMKDLSIMRQMRKRKCYLLLVGAVVLLVLVIVIAVLISSSHLHTLSSPHPLISTLSSPQPLISSISHLLTSHLHTLSSPHLSSPHLSSPHPLISSPSHLLTLSSPHCLISSASHLHPLEEEVEEEEVEEEEEEEVEVEEEEEDLCYLSAARAS
ncbi:hypothetical protein CRUP_014762, partial [Coryphaenoides rupestris]